MSKRYMIKLTPQGKYFFGGDIKFNVKDSKADKEKFFSYIVKSSKMPQQTSLLGMMRFLLLSNNEDLFDTAKNKIKDNADVTSLIGNQSFTVNNSENDFGAIKSLGPCIILKDDEQYFRAPLIADLLEIDWPNNPTKAVVNGKEVELPIMKIEHEGKEDLYSGKRELKSYFVSAVSGEKLSLDDNKSLFIEDSRIGIDKDYEGKRKDSAFYKQISYRLAPGYSFGFDVEVDDSIKLETYNRQLVKLGADDSMFVFEAKEVANELHYGDNEGTMVVLLSDSYISGDIVNDNRVRYAISQTRPFRFIKTKINKDASYYRINGKNAASSSERYELYEAGSVFFFRNAEDTKWFCEELKNRKDFSQIGYNKYYIKK